MKTKKRNATLKALVNRANDYLECSKDEEKEGRKMLFSFVEQMLMEAGCYQGFNYLYWLNQGYAEWMKAGQPNSIPGEKPEQSYPQDKYIYGPSGDSTRVKFY